jgi:hypothetical protein
MSSKALHLTLLFVYAAIGLFVGVISINRLDKHRFAKMLKNFFPWRCSEETVGFLALSCWPIFLIGDWLSYLLSAEKPKTYTRAEAKEENRILASYSLVKDYTDATPAQVSEALHKSDGDAFEAIKSLVTDQQLGEVRNYLATRHIVPNSQAGTPSSEEDTLLERINEYRLWHRMPKDSDPTIEIELPEDVQPLGPIDLRFGTKFLDILTRFEGNQQTLEVDKARQVVKSNNRELQKFMYLAISAESLELVKEQLRLMSFRPDKSNSIGSLFCFAQGKHHEYQLFPQGSVRDLNLRIVRIST